MPQFILKIDLGGGATCYDICRALKAAHDILHGCSARELKTKRQILDINGNVVGHYEVVNTSRSGDLPEESKPGCFGAFSLKGKRHELRDCENGTGCKWQARCKQSREDS